MMNGKKIIAGCCIAGAAILLAGACSPRRGGLHRQERGYALGHRRDVCPQEYRHAPVYPRVQERHRGKQSLVARTPRDDLSR